MSERTSAPANDPFTPETMHEARTLIALLRRLGVTTALSSADGDPTFIFSQDQGLDDGGLVALMVENRCRAEPDFREALKSLLSEPTEAEQACGSLEQLGFLTSVVWSDGPKPTPALVFEPSGLDAMKPEALAEIEAVRRRFAESTAFADEMIGYLVSMGAAYEALRSRPIRNLPTGGSAGQEGVGGSPAANEGAKLRGFDPDPAMDSEIEAKVLSGLERGIDPAALASGNSEALDSFGFTEEEQVYMAKRSVLDMVKVAVGEKIMETLNAANFRVVREDLIPSLAAYFEAVDAGEIAAVA